MTLDWAIICDAATVREGLAHILGGGIDTVYSTPKEQAPQGTAWPDSEVIGTPAQLSLALRFLLQRAELGRMHQVEVKVLGEDGENIVGATGVLYAPPNPSLQSGWTQGLIIPMSMQIAPKRFGVYSIDIFGDGAHLKSIPFRIEKAQQRPMPTKSD